MSKICLLMPSLRGGGAERVLLNLLDLLPKDIDVTLVVILKKGVYVNQIPNHVRVHYLFSSEIISRVLTKLLQKNVLGFYWKKRMQFLDEMSFDVSLNFIDGIYTSLLENVDSKRKISWVHGSYVSNQNFYQFYKNLNYRKRIAKSRYDILDDIVFVSKSSRDEFVSLFGLDYSMSIIYNPVNAKRVIDMSLEHCDIKLSQKYLNLICVGSLLPVKNYSMLLKALRILKQEGCLFRLRICGSGSLKTSLEKEIRSLQLDDCVMLLGFQTNPYVIMAQSDLFIMPSLSEALPTALIEAMVLGKPTLVTNVPGCNEVVNDGEYGLMADCTVNGLVSCLRQIMNSSTLLDTYARKSRERASIFSDEEFLGKFCRLIGHNASA